MSNVFQKYLNKLKELNELNNKKNNINGSNINEFKIEFDRLIDSIGLIEKKSNDNILIEIYLKDLINDIIHREEEYILNGKETELLRKEISICKKLSNNETIYEKLKKFENKFSDDTRKNKIELLKKLFNNFK